MTSAGPRVLVTGATGFIGTRLCEVLDESDFDIFGTPPRAKLNLSDSSATAEFISRFRPDVVVHLAASLTRSSDRLSEDAQWSDTLLAGRNIVEASVASGTSHLIMAGSLDELGPGMDPTRPRPLTNYGLCKLMVLTLAQHAARTHAVAIDWFRATTVYGPGQRGKMLIPAVLGALVEGKAVDVSDGRQCRDFLFVDDLVDWIVRCIRSRPADTDEVDVHHLGSGQPVPVLAVLEQIHAAFPAGALNIGAIPRRPEEPESFALPAYTTQRPSLDGWIPRFDTTAGIRRTIAWWLDAQHEGSEQ